MSPEDTRLSPHTSCAPESGTQAPSAQGFSRGCRHGVCQGQGHPRAQRGQNRLPSVSTTVARTRPHRLVARGPQPACRSPSPPEQARGGQGGRGARSFATSPRNRHPTLPLSEASSRARRAQLGPPGGVAGRGCWEPSRAPHHHTAPCSLSPPSLRELGPSFRLLRQPSVAVQCGR